MEKIRLAIIGIGRWGKNLAREFNKDAEIAAFCHNGNSENKSWLKKNYPRIPSKNYNSILHDKTINAVVIATPIKTHYQLAKKALLAGKDVFVEKPITDNLKQAQDLVRLAERKKLILFVGHIFSYHPVFNRIKELNTRQSFKKTYFSWQKLGTFNEELIYNLASHDIATAFELFGYPISMKILENEKDILQILLKFKKNRSCTIYINRVSNIDHKTVTLVTDKDVFLWDNNQLLKLDKKTNNFKLVYKSKKTPLEIEVAKFIKCLKQRKNPPTDGRFGAEVIKVLEKIG